MGDLAREGRRYAEAESWYRGVAKIAPMNAEALIGLGINRYEQGDTLGALEYFRRAVALNPGVSKAYATLVDPKEGRQLLDEVLKQQ